MNYSNNPISELLEFSILNIDKPSGPTSFNISDFVRKMLNLRKTSHFGTLDPKVTGVLPIALNRACKLTGFFLGHDKEYVGIMRIHEDVELDKIKKIIKEKFLGKIKQTPPVKSRVKRQEREREIISFEILEKDGKDILFKTKVQGGTYIRKLCDDIGKEIGGAHMLELRRTGAGIFSEEDKEFVNLYDFEKIVNNLKVNNKKINEVEPRVKEDNRLKDNFNRAGNSEQLGGVEELKKILIPAEEALKKIFPVVQVKKESMKRLLTGKPIMKEDLINEDELVNKKYNKVDKQLNKIGLTDDKISKSSIKPANKIKNYINNKEIIASKGEQQINRVGDAGQLGGVENKFIAFCEDKFIGVYDAKNFSEKNFGATKSKAAPTRRTDEDFVGIGKPLFVFQEIK